MDERPIQSDARRARRERRLGNDAACALCGFAELEALVRARGRVIEAHHVVGRANDRTLTVPLCLNHHRIITERLRDAGVSMQPAKSALERLAARQEALAVLWSALAEADARSADEIRRLVDRLDSVYPDWRNGLGGDK